MQDYIEIKLKKNVIIILIDGARLDRVEKSKIFDIFRLKSNYFKQTITSAPYTTAALHALFSGCYGYRTGTNSYWHSLNFQKNKFKSLVTYLKDDGFHTCGDGHSKLILANHDFDEFHIHDETNTVLVNHHSKLLENMALQNKQGKNFLLYLTYSSIHTGIMNQVLKKYNNYSEEYFQNKEENEKIYDSFFQNAEDYFEKIFDLIQNLHLDENSIILVTSDHGISVGEKIGERAYGAFCYDYTVKSFAYLYAKDLPNKEITNQVRHIDFMPTILEYLEIELDKSYEKLDGKSLLPLIKGEKIDEEIAYIETANPLHSNVPPKSPNTKAVRTPKWKLIFNEYNNTKELYDLKNDPDENNNLVGTGLKIENLLFAELKKHI